MANADSHVTIHMAASLDGFIARKDGRVDWLETSDEFVGGDTMDPGYRRVSLGRSRAVREWAPADTFRTIWFVGGGMVSAECLRLGLADEVRYSILPILIGDGLPFFERLDRDVALHLAEVKAYKSGTVELCYKVRR